MKVIWEFDFHTCSTPFNSKELEMEFENEVQIKHFYRRHPSSPDLRFRPRDMYSKKIEIEFLDMISPIETNLVIEFLAEKRPVFKKVVWSDKKNGQKHECDSKDIERFND